MRRDGGGDPGVVGHDFMTRRLVLRMLALVGLVISPSGPSLPVEPRRRSAPDFRDADRAVVRAGKTADARIVVDLDQRCTGRPYRRSMTCRRASQARIRVLIPRMVLAATQPGMD